MPWATFVLWLSALTGVELTRETMVPGEGDVSGEGLYVFGK
jgi:hypothetical protein